MYEKSKEHSDYVGLGDADDDTATTVSSSSVASTSSESKKRKCDSETSDGKKEKRRKVYISTIFWKVIRKFEHFYNQVDTTKQISAPVSKVSK